MSSTQVLIALFGGVSIVPQKKELARGTDIIVATPGRLLDHLEQRTVNLSGVQVLTLDEADRMLDMGFLPPLRRILAVLPKDRQTLLFSATFSPEVIKLSADFTRQPQRVDVSANQVMATTVTHHVYPINDQRKGDLLSHVLRETPGQALVFCRTKHGSNRVGQYLERSGVNAAVIHGNKSQGARTRALDEFKSGKVRVLVATDIAARGLDIGFRDGAVEIAFGVMRGSARHQHRGGFGIDLQSVAEILKGVRVIALRLIGAGAIHIGRDLIVFRFLRNRANHLRASGDALVRIGGAALIPARIGGPDMFGSRRRDQHDGGANRAESERERLKRRA